MTPQASLGFLFEAVKDGMLHLRPLTHGFESVCYDLINNDFRRYHKAMKTLREHLTFHTKCDVKTPMMERYHCGMRDSINRAIEDLKMWFTLSKLYYGETSYAHNTIRKLPNGRKIIELFDKVNATSFAKEKHDQRGKKKVSTRK